MCLLLSTLPEMISVLVLNTANSFWAGLLFVISNKKSGFNGSVAAAIFFSWSLVAVTKWANTMEHLRSFPDLIPNWSSSHKNLQIRGTCDFLHKKLTSQKGERERETTDDRGEVREGRVIFYPCCYVLRGPSLIGFRGLFGVEIQYVRTAPWVCKPCT
jgi:hypothetical protein